MDQQDHKLAKSRVYDLVKLNYIKEGACHIFIKSVKHRTSAQ